MKIIKNYKNNGRMYRNIEWKKKSYTFDDVKSQKRRIRREPIQCFPKEEKHTGQAEYGERRLEKLPKEDKKKTILKYYRLLFQTKKGIYI